MRVTLSLPRWMVRTGRLSIFLIIFFIAIFLYHPYQTSFRRSSTSSAVDVSSLYDERDGNEEPQRVFDKDKKPLPNVDQNQVKVEPVKENTKPKVPVQPHEPAKPKSNSHKSGSSSSNSPRDHLPWIDPPTPDNVLPPLLVTKPSSPELPFVRYPHELPYKGTSYHLSASVHPAKHQRKSEFVLNSLWYIEQDEYWDWVGKMVQARLPTVVPFISFTVEYSLENADKDAEETLFEEIQCLTIEQGRHEYVLVECALPEWVSDKLDTKKSREDQQAGMDMIRRGTIEIKAWADLGDVTKEKTEGVSVEDPHLAWRKNAHQIDLKGKETTTDDHGGVHLHMVTHTIKPSDWLVPTEQDHVKLSVCVSPVRLQPKPKDDVTRLKDYLEWRIWHMYQGVGAVHWYARDPLFGVWVDKLNYYLGLNDTYLTTPVLSELTPEKGKPYADQAVWIQDCLMRYGFTDEWQAHIDLDEYMYPRYDASPYGTIHRLDRLAPNVATFASDHTYYRGERLTGDNVPKIEEFSHFPRNAYTHWDTLSKHDGFRRQKSIHRTAGATLLWVHGAAGLGNGYRRVEDDPIPEAVKEAETSGSKPPEDVVSNLEILHDRRPMPQALTFEWELEKDIADRWESVWKRIGDVLSRDDLSELYDVEKLWPGYTELSAQREKERLAAEKLAKEKEKAEKAAKAEKEKAAAKN
ncbi:hypothetical protein I317_06804 [Kwoniella heveanensis CBS 569]|nr:hypothetical protein I317_06804 [Kwoniella heveanensis CBS 569]